MPGNSKIILHGERKGLNTDSAEQVRYFEQIEAREVTRQVLTAAAHGHT